MLPHGGVIGAAGSGGAPPAGTVILGTEPVETGRSTNNSYGNNGMLYHSGNVPFTASWAESAATCVLAALKAHYKGNTTGNLKLALYDSNKALIAVSDQLSVVSEGSASNKTATFSSQPTITKGATYIIGFIESVNYLITFSTHASTGSQIYRNTSGTFASPPSDLTNNNTSHQSNYAFDLWGTA